MPLPNRYDPHEAEPRLSRFWQEAGSYHFHPGAEPVYSIDTPPPTVSGNLHLGSVYSYCHPDFIARFRRMRGDNVYYPMGYDDNGLATERLVERETGKTAEEMGREAFTRACLELTPRYEQGYEALWRRLGLSVDWRYTYRTIDDLARHTSQLTFLDLYRRGFVYRRRAPAIWCPTCKTAIAQAEVNDLDRHSELVTFPFTLQNGETLPIASTRPELLPACVAVFVHPDDVRYRSILGRHARVPLFGQEVPVLADSKAEPGKGTGAVMCCTFGDSVDIVWWYRHDLPLREAIDRNGEMLPLAGRFSGLSTAQARQEIIRALEAVGLLLARDPIEQSVRVHERCDTPVEYIVAQQWFVRVLDRKPDFIAAGSEVGWHPPGMETRYREWVENLHWDWCISRQRYYGVPFPVWYCDCGEELVAREDQLPVDPTIREPPEPCSCGSSSYRPEEDVMDTWATSSCSPQIAGRWLSDPALYRQVFPMSLRPQAHDIIRTWVFDTVVMSLYRPTLGETGSGVPPWRNILISGWGLAPGGTQKISKSRGGGPLEPLAMLERYSADAARYWAASTGPGKDAIISEEKIASGAKLVTKIWNVARFAERFVRDYAPPNEPPKLSTADVWILSLAQRLVQQVTDHFLEYEYAVAKNATEDFFWSDLCDNYLEMAKKRLYDPGLPGHAGACFTLYRVLLTVLKLFAPILPYITEEVYQGLFWATQHQGTAGNPPPAGSIHRSAWPESDESLINPSAEAAGTALVAIATTVRRYKSDHALSLGAALKRVHLVVPGVELEPALQHGREDIASVTRAAEITIGAQEAPGLEILETIPGPVPLTVCIAR
jgi:valyl-tRNA synthetase